jgi:phosphoglycolate phosphatase
MKYNTILFDLDGTLLNTLDDLHQSVNAVMIQKGYPLRTINEIRAFIGDGAKMLMKRSLPECADEDEVTCCLELFRCHYVDNMLNSTRPYAGIMELLKELKQCGLKIGVVSNKPDEATREMCRMFFDGVVDAATGDNQERRKKPAPDNVFEVMKQLGAEKESTLYVGDSDTDIITARNAGLISVGVTWGFRPKELLISEGANFIVDRPDQILTLLTKAE